ncbi:Sec-independent protein translocase subunit TatA/TatB [Pedobacter sp. AW31-3R]|uniref:Sec-independent protein translocase subunit TatA/TatB n=1 Tax=Pedobacter sp. AW31-3R TaxID=3445781 RepID=UPI003FA05688
MLNTTILAALGTTEIILILVAVLLLFGGKKIPELMRGLGKGIKEFKDGKDGADENDAVDPNRTNTRKPL